MQLDSTRMATVIADLGRAEAAAAQVHAAFRALEKKHAGGPKGLATLEVRAGSCRGLSCRAMCAALAHYATILPLPILLPQLLPSKLHLHSLPQTQSLEGCVPCEAVDRAAPASLSELAADAPAEATGGQCC